MAEGPPVPEEKRPDDAYYRNTHLTMRDLGLSSDKTAGRLDADLSKPPVLDGVRSEADPISNAVGFAPYNWQNEPKDSKLQAEANRPFTPTPYNWQHETPDSTVKSTEKKPGADSFTPNNVHHLDDYRKPTSQQGDTEESGGHKPA